MIYSNEKSLIPTVNVEITKCALSPIILHPATEYLTRYTCMTNYQDIDQRHIRYSPLWCDEGVYYRAKEIQPLKPDEFKISP